jgi:hypothetical protein
MNNFLYKWLVESKSRNYDLYIKNAITIIEKYNLWHSNDYPLTIDDLESDFSAFKTVTDGKTVVDIFKKNIHIHVSVTEREKIYSIRIKEPGAEWDFEVKNGVIDFSHPTNKYYEVYVWYIVPVLDITTSEGYVYKHGSWDKYVYRTMRDFFSDTNDETDSSKFNSFYK